MVAVAVDPQVRTARQAIDALLFGLRSAGAAGSSDLRDLRALPPESAVDALLELLADRSDPLLVVFDDLHHAGLEARELILRVVSGMPPPHRSLVLTRRPFDLGSSLASAAGCVEATDLAFTDAEVDAVLSLHAARGSPADAAVLRRATSGWAAAVVLSARRIAAAAVPAEELRRLTAEPLTVIALVNAAMAGLSTADRDAAIQLAHLPAITPRLVGAIGAPDGVIERLLDAGLPAVASGERSFRLIDPVGEVIRQAGRLRADVAAAAADVLADEGEPLVAYWLLSGSGAVTRGVDLLEALPDRALERFDYADLSRVIDDLPTEIAATAPRLLLAYARTCEQAGHKLRRDQVLTLVETAVRGTGTPVERELDAERAATSMRESLPDEAAALARRVLGECGAGEHATRIRLLEVLARVAAASLRPEALAVAEADFRQAMQMSLDAGHPAWAVRSAVPLAARVYWPQGRHHDAARCLTEALDSLPTRGRQRGFVLTFRAEVLVDSGEYDEAAVNLTEAHELGRALHDRRTVAYAAWVEARQASQAGNAARLVDRLGVVERHRAEWYSDHSTGVDFCADAAAFLDRAGDTVGARAYLQRAQARRDEDPRSVAIAEAALEARSGDPHVGSHLLDRLLADVVPPVERWRLLLLRAYASHRAGAADAGTLAAAAFDAAALTDVRALPLIRERAIAEELLGMAIDHGSAVAAQLDVVALPTRISILGGFAVHRGGRDLTPPAGRAAQLVKLLAVSGGRCSVELVTEALWPDDVKGAGRVRVRNVLSRLHHACPDLVVRDGEALVFGPGVTTDLERFHAEATRAVTLAQRADAAATAAARAVLSRYRGPVLPHDLREEWAAVPREAALRRVLSILDVLTAQAERAGDMSEAAELAERAAASDRTDDGRLVRAARLQLRAGRSARARELASRARRLATELRVRPSAELLALEGELDGA
ncbi:MAG: hypothetical protein JF887_02145 [Candidatus Dormibacteraeota bacterium]|uniref:Bacterial transcriptional activator domain-containing protein n=1 Tax=Candidatus Amunia macphersoniae TaxID=3127014 RepID=A0A934KB49_9BACT|nr:hypothetical protein [Candidatus Dormibacteraeota bacterium]